MYMLVIQLGGNGVDDCEEELVVLLWSIELHLVLF